MNVHDLLEKETCTGEEVGALIIDNLTTYIKTGKSILYTEDLEDLRGKLSEEDNQLVDEYIVLGNVLADAREVKKISYQQFYNGYNEMNEALKDCRLADMAESLAEKHPVIMTEGQYTNYITSSKERALDSKHSFVSVLFNTLFFYFFYDGEFPEELETAITEQEKRDINNPNLDTYMSELLGNGYYILPDGTKSSDLSREEWRLKVDQHFYNSHKFLSKIKKTEREEALKEYSIKILNKLTERLFNSPRGMQEVRNCYHACFNEELILTDEEIFSALDYMVSYAFKYNSEVWSLGDIKNQVAPISYATKHPYIDCKLNYVFAFLADPQIHEFIPFKYQYNRKPYNGLYILARWLFYYEREPSRFFEFKKDFPELFEVVSNYIRENISDLADIEEEQFFTPIITYRRIKDLNYSPYKIDIDEGLADMEHFSKEELKAMHSNNVNAFYRSKTQGIAIIQEPYIHGKVDSMGNYKEPKNPLSLFRTLEDIYEDDITNMRIGACRTDIIIPCLKNLYAYNEIVGIIEDIYEIDLTAMLFPMPALEEAINNFNKTLFLYYATVYGQEEDKAIKRFKIKKLFKPIDLKKLKPTRTKIKTVTKSLEDARKDHDALEKLKDITSLINMLKR